MIPIRSGNTTVFWATLTRTPTSAYMATYPLGMTILRLSRRCKVLSPRLF